MMCSGKHSLAWTALLVGVLLPCLSFGDQTSTTNRRKRAFSSKLKFGMKPPDKTCLDFCKVHPLQCKNGGTCILDQVTCGSKCACAPGWTGRWCDSTMSSHRTSIPVNGSENKNKDVNTNAGNSVKAKRNFKLKENSTTFDHVWAFTSGSKFNKTSKSDDLIPFAKFLNDSGPDLASLLKQGDQLPFENFTVGGHHSSVVLDKRTMSTSNSTRSRSCFPGFTCIHGYCDMEALKNKTMRCICEKNYVDTFCDKVCPLKCGEHGQCGYFKNGTYGCVCEWRYTGVKCDQLVPEPSVETGEVIMHWYVIGPSLGAVLLMLAALVCVPYWMWKRRLVVILKIIHYFKQYEDDDGKDFDAFVSFKSSPADERFVLQQLLPRLEDGLNFKLCLHFRDFQPGEAIANNIVRAIESSRRTIMVLSPAYVESEWCRMEYQKAQHEMLKLKHKIIPIVLEDISDVQKLDKNLKCILNSVTYIEWPGEEHAKKLDKFWKKVELSLPKKSSTSSSSSSSTSSSSTSSSSYSSSTLQAPLSSVSVLSESSLTSTEQATDRSKDVSTPRPARKRRNLKHFMSTLVRAKFFSRQDSSSSQTALVDDESSGRGSLDSYSDNLTADSSESACSTPTSAHSNKEKPVFYCGCNRKVCAGCERDTPCGPSVENPAPISLIEEHHSGSYIDMDISGRYRDFTSGSYINMGDDVESPRVGTDNGYMNMSGLCQYMNMKGSGEKAGNSQVDYVDMNFSSDYVNMDTCKTNSVSPGTRETLDDADSPTMKSPFCSVVCARRSQFTGSSQTPGCASCKQIRERSDNNRVRISAVNGVNGEDVLKIEKLPPVDLETCSQCSENANLRRYHSLRKQQKDEVNRKLVRQKRVGSLERTRKQGVVLNIDVLRAFSNQTFIPEPEGSRDKDSCYIDICEKV